MRKLAVVGAFALFALVGCTNKNSPEYVATQFINAMNTEEYIKAKEFCDDETDKIMDFLDKIKKEGQQNNQKQQKIKQPKVTIVKTEEKNGKAKVTYYLDDNKNQTASVDLVKVNDKWLVHISKEGKENKNGGGDLQDALDHDDHDHNHDHQH